jgi:cytidyltransferase-like protein
MRTVVISGSFDDTASPHVRLLHEASQLGNVHVLLWSDENVRALEGKDPKLPQEERNYFLQAIRYVARVTLVTGPVSHDSLPSTDGVHPDVWIVTEKDNNAAKKRFCAGTSIEYRVLHDEALKGFPTTTDDKSPSMRKKVIVTGCYDWFHSGHVRFFEEVSELGDLHVIVGHDANIRLLKGEGHPMFSQDERRYMVQAIRHVKQALISTGHGWLDAEPEIMKLKPDMYAVNEDGDKPEKKEYCARHNIQYVVLKRIPKEGLPRRQSTDLRGF